MSFDPQRGGAIHLLNAYPPETLADGDVLITNDPWMTAGQVNDFTVMTPVFRGETIVGYDTVGLGRRAWIWTSTGGMVRLDDHVLNIGIVGANPLWVCRAVSGRKPWRRPPPGA